MIFRVEDLYKWFKWVQQLFFFFFFVNKSNIYSLKFDIERNKIKLHKQSFI